MTDLPLAIDAAARRIRPYVRETPIEYSLPLSQQLGCDVALKCEHLQHTGSFKLRGAMAKISRLSSAQASAGIVAASSGNHGAAVAYGLRALKLHGVVFVPNQASATKVDAMRRYGVEVRHVGDDGLDTELAARAYADEHGMTYISPYNDLDVIAGQGTLAIELLRQTPAVDVVYIAVGGGGLISGVASYLKARAPRPIQIVGCLPERSPAMAAAVQAGQIIEVPTRATLSDGTAGGIEAGSVTFPLCQQLVDRWVLVPEPQIAAAVRLMVDAHHQIVEGAAGVALAALIADAPVDRGAHPAVVLCGANISTDTLRAILA